MTDIDRELLLQTFLADAGEHLDELEKSVVALESAPDDDELVNTIFRVAHTVKGDAMMVGFQATAEFAHHLEDLLDRIRDRVVTVSAPLISVLLEGVDTLRALLNAAAAGRDEMRAADRELMERLSAMRAGPAELAVETAELMEHFLWVDCAASREVTRDPSKRQAVAEELADVACHLFNLCASTSRSSTGC